MSATLRQAVEAVQQQRQANPVQSVAVCVERVPLGKSVQLCNGMDAIITGHSTCDCNSYRVSWFDRRLWAVIHKWVQRGAFEVIQTKTLASGVEVSVS